LRRAIAVFVERIVLDPHGYDGDWFYSVHLKGAYEDVEIVCRAKPESCGLCASHADRERSANAA
jgi:hypothetical protein